MTVAILTGGLATRLRPFTETIPKALVDVAGKPFIVRQLEYLRRQGIERVVLCIGHLGENIETVVGNGFDFNIDVKYSWDGPRLLGTGGALLQALPLLGDQFFVLYGDSYLPINFGAVERGFLASGKPAMMTVLRNCDRWDQSNVIYHDGSIVEYNKRTPKPEMAYIDYGLGVLTSSVLVERPAEESFDLSDIYHELSLRGLLAGHEVFERFYEIGSYKGLQEAIEFFRREEIA